MPNETDDVHQEFEAFTRAHCNFNYFERDRYGGYISSFTRDLFSLFKATRLFYLSQGKKLAANPQNNMPTSTEHSL